MLFPNMAPGKTGTIVTLAMGLALGMVALLNLAERGLGIHDAGL